jgi:predicted transcriptional regulator of viral defense system
VLVVLKLDDTKHRRLAGLLAEQADVVSVRQLHTLGVTESRVRARLRSGAWQRGYSGTYVAHNGALTFMTRLWSALLYAGEGAMASYHTAAWLHRLEEDSSRIVHITIPSDRRVADQRDLVVHLNGRASAQEQLASVPPRTNVEETVLDIASS